MSSGFLGGGIGPTAIKRRAGLAAPVPVAGAELIVNGGFDDSAGWTLGTGWSIADSQLVASSANFTAAARGESIFSVGTWYRFTHSIVSASTNVSIRAGSIVLFLANSTTPSVVSTRTLAGSGANYGIFSNGTALNAAINSVSCKSYTLSSLFSSRPYGSADCDLSAAVTRTAGTQAGLVARLDSNTSPANFIIAYLDGAGNVKVDKCVAGTYTNVISGAITYGAGYTLRLLCNGTAVSAYYNGAFVGTAQVTDAGIVSNTRHGLFSTYASNAFAAYTNAVDSWTTSETAPVPVAGAELLANGGFESWSSATNADWWAESIAGSSTITQSADAHTGTGAALMTVDGSSSTTRLDAPSNITSPNVWYALSAWTKANLASKTIYLGRTNYPFVNEFTHTVTTSYVQYLRTGRGRNTATTVMIQAVNSSTQYIVDDVSFVPLTLSSLFSSRPYASANCDLSAAITRTAGTQAGLVARLDSSTSPANFLIAYLDGAGNVKVDKCVAGTYTNVISGAVTYGSTKILRLVCSGNNVSAYYDGTQVGSTVTVSDAGIVSNTRHGLFSTYAANSFAGYVAA